MLGPSYSKDTNSGVKGLNRHHLNFYMVNDIHVVLSNGALSTAYGEQSLFFRVFRGPFWPLNQLDVTYAQYCKLHLVMRDGQLGLYFTHYLFISFRSLLYVYLFWKASNILDFHNTTQMVFNFSYLSSYSPISLFPCPST